MSKQNELVELARTGASGGGNKNLIINGAMQVAQRGTSATVSNGSNEGYSTVDRFYLNFNAGVGGAINFSQSSDAPSGFANSIKMQCSTTNTSFSTTNAINLEYRPEAQDLQRLGYGTSDAKKMTISWYMKAVNFSDPISLALETRDGTAEYFVKSYTPTTSWVRYTCTVPESTSATINDDNGQGIFVKFVIAGFSSGTYAVSADSTAWSTTRADYVDDIGNFTSSTSNELYITGVQMELGEKATDFEHRSFGDELARCQRYFQKYNYSNNLSDAATANTLPVNCCYNTSVAYGGSKLTQEMRTSPTFSASAASSWVFYSASSSHTASFMTAYETGPFMWGMQYQTSGSWGAGNAVYGRPTGTSSYYQFDAEL